MLLFVLGGGRVETCWLAQFENTESNAQVQGGEVFHPNMCLFGTWIILGWLFFSNGRLRKLFFLPVSHLPKGTQRWDILQEGHFTADNYTILWTRGGKLARPVGSSSSLCPFISGWPSKPLFSKQHWFFSIFLWTALVSIEPQAPTPSRKSSMTYMPHFAQVSLGSHVYADSHT